MIDTNIILDVLFKREPFWQNSLKIWKLSETNIITSYISTLSFANISYILRKYKDKYKINEIFEMLNIIFYFSDLTYNDLEYATKLEWNDFEDSIQAVSAKRIKADYIITRNLSDFKYSDIPAITPNEFLSLIVKEYTNK